MKFMRALILFLMVSFIVQNTCPYGLAAKTAFATPHTHDCPLKKSHDKSSGGQDSFDTTHGKILNAAFVLLSPATHSVMQPDMTNAYYVKFTSNSYANHFKEPLFKPPAF